MVRLLSLSLPTQHRLMRSFRPGDVTYLHIFGQGLVFLSGNALFDLLDKRGTKYSDRLKLVMAGELSVTFPFTFYPPHGSHFTFHPLKVRLPGHGASAFHFGFVSNDSPTGRVYSVR